MAHDECRVEMIDGDPIRVHGSRLMDAEDRAAFAQIVVAARAKFRADHLEPTVCEKCGVARHMVQHDEGCTPEPTDSETGARP